jgi:hypothetical protein
MRPFGSDVGDLDVDFTSRSPLLVTDLLRRCDSLTDDDAWNMAVGARTEALVQLAILSSSQSLVIGLRCPNAGCQEALEIELELSELWAASADRARDTVSVRIGDDSLELRRPTGRDQRDWLATAWPGVEEARSRILASLLSTPSRNPLDASAIEALENELARIDPLVAFNLAVACPACGDTAEHTLDLQRHALATLRRIHERLFESVARLATHFHWTEAEIFALPLWRRDRYLAMADSIR